MSLTSFLADLFDDGRLKVGPPAQSIARDDQAAAIAALIEHDALLRQEFPGLAPPLDQAVALWAAMSFYRACQLAVYRELDAGAIDELLAEPCPAAEEAARHWSVDVVFRFLPDLVKHAARAASDDPLVARLRVWAAQWPLSSVGIANLQLQHVDQIVAHPGLLQLYVDRILAKKDWSRLDDPVVREAVRQSLGGHAELWPEVAGTLRVPSP